ncbi:MAG TPA: PQQ-binding-like beta-propeller repeat protein, partial [Verrucomicrobiae bacterium]
FYALMPGGKLRWKFPTQGQIISSPAINSDGTIYFSSTDGNLYALKPDGSELWRLHTGGATESSPVLDGQGEIYIAVNYSKAGVSAAGKKIWEYGGPVSIDATPTVAANGLIYFSSPWAELAAFDSRGNEHWLASIGSIVRDSAAIGRDGTIYVTDDRNLNAITVTNGAPPAKSSWPMFRANPRHTGRVPDVN